MKTTTHTNIILGIMLFASAATNVIFADTQYKRDQALDKCAAEQNVYKCHWVAEPVTAPRVVTVQAALLPFPEELK